MSFHQQEPAPQPSSSTLPSQQRAANTLKRDSSSSTEGKEQRVSKQPVLDDDGKTSLLAELLTDEIFGKRTKKLERCCIEYIVAMRNTPMPQPSKFAEFVRQRHSSATVEALGKGWKQLKAYFTSDISDIPKTIMDLMDVNSFAEAFKNAPNLDLATLTAGPSTATFKQICADNSSSASGRSPRTRSSYNSGSGSSSSGSSLNTVGLAKMRDEFSKNYSTFKGEAWTLASGMVVDEIIAERTKLLQYETALHSFIIEDTEVILDLFPDDTDKAEVKTALEQPPERHTMCLSDEELQYLALYDKPPSQLKNIFANGYANTPVPDGLVLPDQGLREIIHHCLQHLYLIYRKENFVLPLAQTESWYVNRLWSIIGIIFDSDAELSYQPGETISHASTLRKNKGRSFDQRQLAGRRTDGLIIASDTRLEVCVLEAAKKDVGSTSTKALNDTRKLAKTMKDMHDLIRERSKNIVRSSLRTYGIRISGASFTLYSLRQLQGRFYQLCHMSTEVLPAQWRSSTTTHVLSILARLLAFKKELTKTADEITWASKSLAASSQNNDCWAATLSTPTNSPRLNPFDL